MSRSSIRIFAIVLLAAFLLWLVFTVFPITGVDDSEPRVRPTAHPEKTYEPKFRDEGDLYFLSAEGDTIRKIDIELADEPSEIQYGMMYRKSMDPNTGMLFLMGEERPQSFWMKNTYVSLDIIFINDHNEVVNIQKNARPLSEESLPSEEPASKVLEVKGGFADQYGIGKGMKIAFKTNQ